MMDKISVYTTTPCTVHSWLIHTPNKTFDSLRQAIEYASEHADQLDALEVFVHGNNKSYDIISGDELALLIARVCSRA
ncbi:MULTISPECIES: hypothetical protein [unclassified Rhizobium]|uniref:hypothetical protein n=1 Tax=unclassified Rhizobium TaxID=2613769 RepID=UPI0017CD800E|nr:MULTISPECIES: hypothetical protein [unclassified Rhizobium]MBB3350473.1 hypothetical protein [Rhizobium sp. BK049]MDK4735222.1 hypothetical protein [Rhizobium sp. CNPSo 3490]